MLKLFLVLVSVVCPRIFAQMSFAPGTNVPNVCICATAGECAVAGGGAPTDGSESSAFQPRIFNPGSAPAVTNATVNVTVTPITTGLAIAAESQEDCATGLDRCCPPTVGYTCGLRYSPVTNAPPSTGSQANYSDFSFQVVLFSMTDVYIGSGVLIDQLHVLTAAHKVYNLSSTQVKVRVGDWNIFATSEPFPHFDTTGTFDIHPNFTVSNLRNNIAVITLAAPAPLGRFPTISNICLPNTNISGIRCFVSGWGRADNTTTTQNIMRAVDVPLIDSTLCQTQLRATALGNRFALDRNSFICAGGEAGKDACTGDGGAPLSCFIGGRYYLAGLTAWGIGCGTANVPGVYVNVQTYIPWIQNLIRSQPAPGASNTAMLGGTATTTRPATTTAAAATTTTVRLAGGVSQATTATVRLAGQTASTVRSGASTVRAGASTVRAGARTTVRSGRQTVRAGRQTPKAG